jgi:hypothetical protein
LDWPFLGFMIMTVFFVMNVAIFLPRSRIMRVLAIHNMRWHELVHNSGQDLDAEYATKKASY